MPTIDLIQLAIGAVLALVVTGLAYAFHALSTSGAVAAFCLGTVIFGLGGFPWAILLLAFFIPSSVLSFLFKKRKALAESNYEKGSRRDAWQVLANGGLAGLSTLAYWIDPTSILPWLAASAALASASADTWATELGALSRRDPVLITSGKRVTRGTSGGISLEGEVAAFLGALLIAVFSAYLLPGGAAIRSGLSAFGILALVTLSGFIGCQVDSWLGASLQAIYFCPTCQKETEKHPVHTCGSQTLYRRGIRWMNNDWVNILSAVASVLLVLLAILVLTA